MQKDESLQALRELREQRELRELRELDELMRQEPPSAPDPSALFVGIMCALCILSATLLWWISQ